MTRFRVQEAASRRIDEIYRYTRKRWGTEQADSYVTGLFETFTRIASGNALSRAVPAEFGLDGQFTRYERHYIYWKTLKNGDIGIVTVLHERMHQTGRFHEDFEA